jgi:hypothetical protein
MCNRPLSNPDRLAIKQHKPRMHFPADKLRENPLKRGIEIPDRRQAKKKEERGIPSRFFIRK